MGCWQVGVRIWIRNQGSWLQCCCFSQHTRAALLQSSHVLQPLCGLEPATEEHAARTHATLSIQKWQVAFGWVDLDKPKWFYLSKR